MLQAQLFRSSEVDKDRISVAFISLDGGCGKTTLCANLGKYLSVKFRVGLCDLSLESPCLHYHFGLR